MNTLKKVLLCGILAVFALILTGCGATVDTKLSADNNFSGEKITTCTLSKDDFDKYITGGQAALEATIKAYLPSPMTYKISSSADKVTLTFTMAFSNIDDYRTKMEKIFSANPDNKITTEITYVNISTPFNSNLHFEENYTSIDMLGWLKYGLRTDGIVSSTSESDWFSNGTNTIVFNGTEHDSNNKLKLKDTIENYANKIYINTYFLSSGNFDRVIKFEFKTSTLTNLSNADIDVTAHLNGLLSEGAVLTEETSDDMKTYIITMNNFTDAQIASATGKILCDDSTKFAVDIKADVNNKGKVIIGISESADASYYVDTTSYYTKVESAFYLYDGVQKIEGDYFSSTKNTRDDDGVLYYYHELSSDDYEIAFSWNVDYDDIVLLPEVSGKKFGIGISFAVPQDMLSIAKEIAFSRLKDSLPDGAKIKESTKDDMTVYTIDLGLSDNETIENRYKEFVLNLTGEKAKCSLTELKLNNGNPFKKTYAYEMVINTYAITGYDDVNIVFKPSAGSDIKLTENSNISFGSSDSEASDTAVLKSNDIVGTFSNGTAYIGFVVEKVNVVGIIGVIILVLAVLGLCAVIFMSINLWKPAIAKITASKPKMSKMPAINIQTTETQPDVQNDTALDPKSTSDAQQNTNTADAIEQYEKEQGNAITADEQKTEAEEEFI